MGSGLSLRWSAISGITASLIWGILAAVGGFLRPGYNPLTQAISELGDTGAPLGSAIAERAVIALLGLLTILLAVGLHRGVGSGPDSRAGLAFMAVFGVFNIIQALFFPCDPGCVNTSFTGAMHSWIGLAGFLALILGMLALSQRMRKDERWKRYSAYSVVSVIVFVGLYVGNILGYGAISSVGIQGLVQRIVLGVPILWIGIVALRLLHLSNKSKLSVHAQVPS